MAVKEVAINGQLFTPKVLNSLVTVPNNTAMYQTNLADKGIVDAGSSFSLPNEIYEIQGIYNGVAGTTYFLKTTNSSHNSEGWVKSQYITFKS